MNSLEYKDATTIITNLHKMSLLLSDGISCSDNYYDAFMVHLTKDIKSKEIGRIRHSLGRTYRDPAHINLARVCKFILTGWIPGRGRHYQKTTVSVRKTDAETNIAIQDAILDLAYQIRSQYAEIEAQTLQEERLCNDIGKRFADYGKVISVTGRGDFHTVYMTNSNGQYVFRINENGIHEASFPAMSPEKLISILMNNPEEVTDGNSDS